MTFGCRSGQVLFLPLGAVTGFPFEPTDIAELRTALASVIQNVGVLESCLRVQVRVKQELPKVTKRIGVIYQASVPPERLRGGYRDCSAGYVSR